MSLYTSDTTALLDTELQKRILPEHLHALQNGERAPARAHLPKKNALSRSCSRLPFKSCSLGKEWRSFQHIFPSSLDFF